MDDIGEGEETKIRWFDSEAYQLLYNDLLSGEASSDLSADDIYVMRPEYSHGKTYSRENRASEGRSRQERKKRSANRP